MGLTEHLSLHSLSTRLPHGTALSGHLNISHDMTPALLLRVYVPNKVAAAWLQWPIPEVTHLQSYHILMANIKAKSQFRSKGRVKKLHILIRKVTKDFQVFLIHLSHDFDNSPRAEATIYNLFIVAQD